jgi:ribonuclease PH
VDGRSTDAIREITIETGFLKNPEGSVLYRCGGTRVLIAASVEESVPTWMRGKGNGWVTAEYAMHPRANPQRKERDGRKGRIDGRTQEIQRLVGRALRSAVDMSKLGERQITIDCDVLDADGGTRTASITGGYVALAQCVSFMKKVGMISKPVLKDHVAAISCGIYKGTPVLDLDYDEDSTAETDANFVITGSGGLVEIQGTAEGAPFSEDELAHLLRLAKKGIGELVELQKQAVA